MAEKRALVCEDDAAIRNLVRMIVQREGFAVDVAENGREGMSKLDHDCYELLVLDLMMPEVDGYAVVQHLKEKKSPALKQVIVMTAVSEAIRQDFPEPIWTLLPKPFSIDALAAAVRHCARACAE
jgi:DNA-binding response OmpR family regulator